MMATPAVSYTVSRSSTVNFAGTLAIFGGELDAAQILLLLTDKAKPATLALLAWIFILVGMIIVLLGVVLPLFKVKGGTCGTCTERRQALKEAGIDDPTEYLAE